MASRYWQLVQCFGQVLAAQQLQTLVQLPGNLGWSLRHPDPASQVPDIRLGYREEVLHEQGAPPRVVCIAQGGPIVPPDQVGGGRNKDGTTRAKNERTRQFTLKVYVWGQDDEQSENLLHNAILAFQHCFSDAPQPGKAPEFGVELWEDQQTGEGGQETYGSLISFPVQFEINVTDAPQPLTIVHTIDNALSISAPATDDAPEQIGETRNVEITG